MITQFNLRAAFNQWSENCNLSFEFKQLKILSNLIKQNLRVCGRTKNCFTDFILKEDIDIFVLFIGNIKAKQGTFRFDNSTKSFIKNGLLGWAAVPDPKRTLSLMVIDYNQSWVPIVQTHDYTIVNLLGVMAHEIGNIISLSHSRDRFSLKHSNYRNWLNTVEEDDIKGCNV